MTKQPPRDLEDVEAFLRTQDPDRIWNPHNGRVCPLAALLTEQGYTDVQVDILFRAQTPGLCVKVPPILIELQSLWMDTRLNLDEDFTTTVALEVLQTLQAHSVEVPA